MLEDEVDCFHSTRVSYPHLIYIELDPTERMSSAIGHEAVGAALSILGPDGLHVAIAKFIQSELDI